MTQPLMPLDLLRSAPPAKRPVVALGEGHDPRIVAGALAAQNAGIADVILVGETEVVRATLAGAGGEIGDGVSIHDPATSDLTDGFAAAFHALRKHKGVDEVAAHAAARTPLVYAALLVREGHADGTVSGAVTSTSDVVRTAIQVIGKAEGAAMVSSFFLMYPPEDGGDLARAMIYSDCALMIDPSSQELAAIATASAASCRAFMRVEPKIAMLSFSTKGSASHERVTKVADAAALVRGSHPDLVLDGEFQFDAAFVPSVGQRKAPGSDVAGQANVMIFPNLDAGNIAYKITQRVGDYAAIGPILQGLRQPANDLSRGCVAGDVMQMIAATVLQAEASRTGA